MLKNNHLYKKVSSYEGNYGEVKKVLLLYSGGLDTSVMLKWIQDQYKAEVYTLTLDLGQQHDNLEAIRQKAVRFGAKKALVWNVKDEFAESYLSLAIKANASYQGNYHLSTPIGRALMAVKTVEAAKKLEVETIAHGCTGKGNDQVRLEGYILTHDPKIKIIAPVREWSMDRSEEIKYAQKNKIPIPSSIDFPYSVDDNMWGMTWEGGEVEIPSEIPQLEKFLTTYTLASKAPDKEEVIVLEFENGLPVSLNGKKYKLADLVQKLNVIVGKHGVGVVHLLEDRLVGLKTRGVYEMPAAAVIIAAHKDLEKYVSTRKLNQLKSELDIKWGYLCYGALWFDPVMKAINCFNEEVNKKVIGKVTVRLYKGQATIVALESPYALDYASFSNSDGFAFNTNCSAGFIEIYSLQMRLSNQKQIK
ncbi:argininosuccinate synthase [Candidatus Gottesmanbacteria bacterium RIFCSPLOWO2_02_FULL_42_29]|uniref:Argininosuccinate synthase n=1 Tax=Candidatus Gottesmanbacteria bacterium RIFCSPLOWO2_01_FULL_42_22 TaxID=1798391 RepID=A0A1F6BJV0_9BACT|nr:MAG: argininosuccinate synthase [Candidatus Gottesmanbacteria bacterium RIFCSPLOWO2_02_FULL_42_29]OGG37216.1 MAG: argininosuccinate synthase [Candidatus Gottesmanbacteria bacterium RIFCSPLOWO2_01_FULL_42_22]